jgi:hypothetical protein
MQNGRGPEPEHRFNGEISSQTHKSERPAAGSLAALTSHQLTEATEQLEAIQEITVQLAETIGAKLLGLELQARCMSQAVARGERDRAAAWNVELTDNVDAARRLVDRLIESTRTNRARARIRGAVVNLDAGNLVDGAGVRQAARIVAEPGRRGAPRSRRRIVAAIAGGIAIAGAAGAWIAGAVAAVAAIAGAIVSTLMVAAAALTSAPESWR